MRELKKQYSDINSRMPRHSCCEVRVMQLHDILLLRTSAILPEAIISINNYLQFFYNLTISVRRQQPFKIFNLFF